jgi:hypothetical protein
MDALLKRSDARRERFFLFQHGPGKQAGFAFDGAQ